MELLVLNKLKWDLASVTPHDFIEHFLSKLKIYPSTKQILRKHAQTFVALCATGVTWTLSLMQACVCVCEQKTEFWVSQVSNERAVVFIPGKLCCAVLTDVNFIASPPSMVAAGSVAAAVQGLYLKSQDASLSSQNLTNFLSQVIRSDPVWKRFVTYLMFAVQLVLTQSQFCACRTACGHVRSR